MSEFSHGPGIDEVANDPPAGIEFCFPDASPPSFRLIRSSVMGYMRGFDDDSCDVFEAVFSPIVTRKPWILSTDSFHAAITFTLMGAPLPRSLRLRYVESILKKDNFKRLTLWGEAALRELEGILHETDIYLLPTYAESFGFALLAAMAYGLPVIATNEFAIPEIVDHGKTGFLIDISKFNVLSFVRGYEVQTIPEDFHQYVSGQLFDYLVQLIESPELRRDMGERKKSVALSKFAIETRNQQMLDIYRSCIG